MHLGTGLDVLFQVVGVQFDETRHQVVAVEVEGADHPGSAGVDGGDPASGDAHGAEHDVVGEHQPGVADDQVGRHAASLPPARS